MIHAWSMVGGATTPGKPLARAASVVDVDGVLVAHGVDPVADHGLVDLVGASMGGPPGWPSKACSALGQEARRRRRDLVPASRRTALTAPPGSCPGRPWPRSRAGSR